MVPLLSSGKTALQPICLLSSKHRQVKEHLSWSPLRRVNPGPDTAVCERGRACVLCGWDQAANHRMTHWRETSVTLRTPHWGPAAKTHAFFWCSPTPAQGSGPEDSRGSLTDFKSSSWGRRSLLTGKIKYYRDCFYACHVDLAFGTTPLHTHAHMALHHSESTFPLHRANSENKAAVKALSPPRRGATGAGSEPGHFP